MPVIYLALAHFIADFVLQPDRIVKMKHESWKGNAIHVAIHGGTSAAVLLPYLPNFSVCCAIVIVTLSHFFIDSAKIRIEKSAHRFVKIFLVDQSAHLLLIAGAGFLLMHEPLAPWFVANAAAVSWYFNPLTGLGLIFLILATYGYELVLYQFDRARKHDSRFQPDRCRMVRNLLLFGIAYVLILIFGVYSVAITGA